MFRTKQTYFQLQYFEKYAVVSVINQEIKLLKYYYTKKIKFLWKQKNAII